MGAGARSRMPASGHERGGVPAGLCAVGEVDRNVVQAVREATSTGPLAVLGITDADLDTVTRSLT
ncbi:hypothetical protein GCM10009635_01070 [Actinocatenispora thailandica]